MGEYSPGERTEQAGNDVGNEVFAFARTIFGPSIVGIGFKRIPHLATPIRIAHSILPKLQNVHFVPGARAVHVYYSGL